MSTIYPLHMSAFPSDIEADAVVWAVVGIDGNRHTFSNGISGIYDPDAETFHTDTGERLTCCFFF